MGIRDESWCADCGKSQPYSPDDVVCGECTSEAYEKRSIQLVEYMKIHLISLEQDLEKLSNQMDELDPNCKDYNELDIEYNWVSGQINATTHLLSVAADIMGIQTKEQ